MLVFVQQTAATSVSACTEHIIGVGCSVLLSGQTFYGALAAFCRCLCVGLMAGLRRLLANGAFLLPKGPLVKAEAPEHPKHPSSTELDAVVNT